MHQPVCTAGWCVLYFAEFPTSGILPFGPARPLLESGVVAVRPMPSLSGAASPPVGAVAASVVGWVVGGVVGWVVGAVVGSVVGMVVGAVVGAVVGVVVGVAVELPRHPDSSSASSAAAPTN